MDASLKSLNVVQEFNVHHDDLVPRPIFRFSRNIPVFNYRSPQAEKACSCDVINGIIAWNDITTETPGKSPE
jgi:hypothetical protein